MRALAGSAFAAASLVGSACVNEEATPPRTVVDTKPPAPKPERAKWTFGRLPSHALGRLTLAGGAKLYLLEEGRRLLVEGDKVTEASSMLPYPARAATKLASGAYVFVDDRGYAMIADEPLGPVKALHAPPAFLRSVSAGAGAIVAIDAARKIQRSTDGGASWSVVPSPGTALHRVESLAIDDGGHGLLLLEPQRLFETKDGGATLARIDAGATAYFDVRLTDAGLAVISARGEHALRDGGQIDALATALSTPYSLASLHAPSHVQLAIADARALRFTWSTSTEASGPSRPEGREVALEIGPVGGAMSAVKTDAFAGCVEPIEVSGNGAELVAGCSFEVDNGRRGSVVVTSSDGGATWKRELSDEKNPLFRGARPVSVGPDGFAFVAARCPTAYAKAGCASAMVRAKAGAAWQPVGSGDEPFALVDTAYDVPGHRVFLLARHAEKLALFEGPLGAWTAPPKLLAIDDAAAAEAGDAVWVAGDGRLWMATTDKKEQLVLRKLGAPASEARTPKLSGNVWSASFHGDRGLVMTSHGAYETADGGASFVRVNAPPLAQHLECTAAGCANLLALRAGWDLPAAKDDATATDVERTESEPDVATPPPSAWLDYVCTETKTTAKLGPYGGAFAVGEANVRWVEGGDWRSGSFTVGGPQSVTKVDLFPTPKKAGARTHVGTEVYERALLGVRYTLIEPKKADPKAKAKTPVGSADEESDASSGGYRPVEVELAWADFDKISVVHRARIAEVPPFRVPFRRGGIGASLVRVDGGVLFAAPARGAEETAVWFAHDDGKVEQLGLSRTTSFEAAVRTKDGVALLSRANHGVLVDVLAAGAKTFELRGWSVATGGSSFELVTFADAAFVVSAGRWSQRLPLFGARRELDDPTPLAPVSIATTPACGPNDGSLPFTDSYDRGPSTSSVRIEGAKPRELKLRDAIVKLRPDGSACLATSIAGSWGAQAFVSRSDPEHAWFIDDEATRHEARGLRCKLK
jgi:photosystem II stability/assembly factor-like uncharacterized protein